MKAALAAARANHLKRTTAAPPPAPSFTSAMNTTGASGSNAPSGSSARRSSTASTSGMSGSSRRSSLVQDEAITELEWGLKSIKTVVEAAKKTGK